MVYNQMKKYAGKVVYSAKESYGREFGMKLEMRQVRAICSRQLSVLSDRERTLLETVV